jgi:hypothetical protein
VHVPSHRARAERMLPINDFATSQRFEAVHLGYVGLQPLAAALANDAPLMPNPQHHRHVESCYY